MNDENIYQKTFKARLISQAIDDTIKKLRKTHKNPMNSFKLAWQEIAPEWALKAIPTMIKNKTLFLCAKAQHATILQFQEEELLKIAQTISKEPIMRIKITSKD